MTVYYQAQTVGNGLGSTVTLRYTLPNGVDATVAPLHALEQNGALLSSSNPLPAAAPDVRAAAQALAANTAGNNLVIALGNGQATLGVQITGLSAAAAVLGILASKDGGTTWYAKNAYAPGSSTPVQSVSADGALSIDVAGLTNVQFKVTTAGTGNISISSSASTAVGLMGLAAPVPAGSNVIGGVTLPGSLGLDHTANAPALPNIGANFGGSGPFASYVLIKTIAANAARACIDIENTSGAQIAVLRDDGTAANGAAPNNASVFPLAGSALGAGQQGGSWVNTTFRGRIQIYAPSSSAFVTVMED